MTNIHTLPVIWFWSLMVFLWWKEHLKKGLSACKTHCRCLYKFALYPDSFEVSVLLSEEGNWLFVCLFRWWQFPTRTEKRIHFCLPVSLSQVDFVFKCCCWSSQSISQLFGLWSSGLTPLHLLAPLVVLFVSSYSSFDPIWSMLRKNNLDCCCSNCIHTVH